jgi:VCBS repeat-containing protein
MSADLIAAFNAATTWQETLAAIKNNGYFEILIEDEETRAAYQQKLTDLPDNQGREQAIGMGVVQLKALFGPFTSVEGIAEAVKSQIDTEHAKFEFITALDGATTAAEMAAAIKDTAGLVNQHRQDLIADLTASGDAEAVALADTLKTTAFTKVLAEIAKHLDDAAYMTKVGELVLTARGELPDGQFYGDSKIIPALEAAMDAVDPVYAFNSATTADEMLAAIKAHYEALLDPDSELEFEGIPDGSGRQKAIADGVLEIKKFFGEFTSPEEAVEALDQQVSVEYNKYVLIQEVDAARTAADIAVDLVQHVAIVNQQRQALIAEWSAVTGNEALAARVAELKADQYTIVLKALNDRLDDAGFVAALSAKFAETRADGHIYGVYGLVDALDKAGDAVDPIYAFNSAITWQDALAAIKDHLAALQLGADAVTKLDELPDNAGREQAIGLGVLEYKALFGNYADAADARTAVEHQIDVEHAKFKFITELDKATTAAEMTAAIKATIVLINSHRQALITAWSQSDIPAVVARAEALADTAFTKVLAEIVTHLNDATYMAELGARMLAARNGLAGGQFFGDGKIVTALAASDQAIDAAHDASISGTSTGSLTEDGSQSTVGGTLSISDEDWGENLFQAAAAADLHKQYGTFTFNETTGVWSFTIDSTAAQSLKKDQAVQQTLTVRSADGTASQTITVTVTGANDGPVAASTGNDISGNEDTIITGMLPAGSDADGDVLTYELVEEVDGLTLNADGSFSYEPASNITGTVTFKYRVVDANGAASEEQSFRITVNSVNDTPDSAEEGNEASGSEDTTITGQVPAGTDVESDELTYELVEEVAGLTFNEDGTFTYVPADDFHGEVTFEYHVVDGDGGKSAARTFTLTINPVNDAPIAAATSNSASGNEDTVITGDLPNGTDVDGDGLTYELVAAVAGLTLNADGTFHYVPAADANGLVEFQYRVVDAAGAKSAPQTFKLTVNAVNDAPRDILLSNASVLENKAAGTEIGKLTASDPEGGAFTFALLDNAGGRFAVDAATGLLTVASNSALDYEQAKSHTIRVQVKDSAGAAYEETFTINVEDVAGEKITGTSTSDVLTGNVGNDVLKAGAGNDTVSGGSGNDTLYGGSGNDKVRGGTGKDTLKGELGKDTFVFDTAPSKSNVDKVLDFIIKDDSFWLDNAVFTKLGKKGTEAKPAQLSKSFFTIGDKAKDKNDYVIYDDKKGKLYYDADGSGKGKQVEIATLSKNLKMTEKDFFVI